MQKLKLVMVGNGMAGIHQQVHEHLIQLRGHAPDQRQRTVVLVDRAFVLEVVPDDVEGRVDPLVQVGHLPLGFADARKILQVTHDLGHA